MPGPHTRSLPRRHVVAAGAGALTAVALGRRPAAARALLARGMAGGGLAQFGEAASPLFANFGMFASAMQMPDGAMLYLGQLRWTEAGSGLVLTAESINQCVPLEGSTDGAEVRGMLTVNQGDTTYPFVAEIFDSGAPGGGLDRINLYVNTEDAQSFFPDAPVQDDFTYTASSTLVAGDFQWIIRDIELDA